MATIPTAFSPGFRPVSQNVGCALALAGMIRPKLAEAYIVLEAACDEESELGPDTVSEHEDVMPLSYNLALASSELVEARPGPLATSSST